MYRIATTYVGLSAISIAAVCLSYPYIYIPWIVLAVVGILFMRDGEQWAAPFWGVLYFIIYCVIYVLAVALNFEPKYIFSLSASLCDFSWLGSSLCDARGSLDLYAFTWSALFVCLFPLAPVSISLAIVSVCEGKKATKKNMVIALLGCSAASLFELYIMRYGGYEIDRYKSFNASARIIARDYGAIIYMSIVVGIVFWGVSKLRYPAPPT